MFTVFKSKKSFRGVPKGTQFLVQKHRPLSGSGNTAIVYKNGERFNIPAFAMDYLVPMFTLNQLPHRLQTTI